MASTTCAHPQKKFAGKEGRTTVPNPFASKKDSPEALFEIMDTEGRGKGTYKFWKSKTREEKLEFCKWLVKKKDLQSKTEFSKKAPGSIVDYIRDNKLWDEICLPDNRSCNKSGCKKKEGPADSLFEMMDVKGRGQRYDNIGFWEKRTDDEMMGYCHWLIKNYGIKTLTELNRKAPRAVMEFVRKKSLQDELGLPDKRLVENSGKKSAAAKQKSGKAPEMPAEKPGDFSLFEKGPQKDDPYAPLASVSISRTPFSPVKITLPLPEPRYRLWKKASKEEKEKMVDELLEAARKGEMYCLRKLLSMGVPVDARNKRGETALMHAALWWHKNMCRYLLQMGANPRARNTHGENALSYAKDGEDRETIELIRNAIKHPSKKGK